MISSSNAKRIATQVVRLRRLIPKPAQSRLDQVVKRLRLQIGKLPFLALRNYARRELQFAGVDWSSVDIEELITLVMMEIAAAEAAEIRDLLAEMQAANARKDAIRDFATSAKSARDANSATSQWWLDADMYLMQEVTRLEKIPDGIIRKG